MKRVLSTLVAMLLPLGIGCGVVGCHSDTEEYDENNHGGIKLEDCVDFVLNVDGGRDVKILQLTDLQIIDSMQQRTPDRLGEGQTEMWLPEKMYDLVWKYMREAVERVQPDLIVLSGDNVYGEFDDKGTTQSALIAELDSYGIPWTLTFGNHDNETRKGVAYTCEQYAQAENCLFRRGPVETVDGQERLLAEGNGNFNIGIVQDGKLTEVVWLMDSNGHTDNDPSQNMFSEVGLMSGQIEWFRERNELLKVYNGGTSPKSIGFFHHPMRAYGDAVKKYGYSSPNNKFWGDGNALKPFSPFEIPENDNGDSGAMLEDCVYIDSSYTFHEMLKKYNCEGWFFGHYHKNSASAVYDGVRYTFGLKASLYDYHEPSMIGGTEIIVGESPLAVRHVYTQYKS